MKVSEVYHGLISERITCQEALPLTQYVPFRFHPNAIWHYKVIIEMCVKAQSMAYTNYSFWEAYLRLRKVSDMSLFGVSNKSVLYWIARGCLETRFYKHVEDDTYEKLTFQISQMCCAGLWREGLHYGWFVYASLLHALTSGALAVRDPKAFDEIYIRPQLTMLMAMSPGLKVETPIGDGWPETVSPVASLPDVPEKISMPDQTIINKDGWTVCYNHRWSGPCYHEHPEGVGVVASHEGRAVLPGDGSPHYYDRVLKFWRWDRPKNHWSRTTWCDIPLLWRLFRNKLNQKHHFDRNVFVRGGALNIVDMGKCSIRLPGDIGNVHKTDNSISASWLFRGKVFHVTSDTPLKLKRGHAWITTGYKQYEKIPALKISGTNLETTVEP